MNNKITECTSFKRLQSLGITCPCEWCLQHTRHIKDKDSYNMIVECIDDDGIMRRQLFNGKQAFEVRVFAIDRFAEVMVRRDLKKQGKDYLNPREEEIRKYVRSLLSPCVNLITGKRSFSRWQMMIHSKEC